MSKISRNNMYTKLRVGYVESRDKGRNDKKGASVNLLKNRVTAVVAGAVVLAGLSATGGAVAAGQIGSPGIRDNSVRSVDVRDGRLFSVDVHNQSLHSKDLAPDSVGLSELKDSVEAPSDTTWESDGPVPVQNIGGSFATRATDVGSFDLQPGTYLLTSNGFFISTDATSGQTRLQLAVRGPVPEGAVWGPDYGTCFTGAASVLADREATCSTTRTVTLDEPTTLTVKAFGYADDQGSADSGKFTVQAFVSALKVNATEAPAPAPAE